MLAQNQPLSFPEIDMSSIQIVSEVVDEWYGIGITFSWLHKPLAQETLEQCEQFGVATRQPQVEGKALMAYVFRLARTSAAWRDFYKEKHVVSCDENGSNDAQRTVLIPEFSSSEDCDDWEFHVDGGHLSFSVR